MAHKIRIGTDMNMLYGKFTQKGDAWISEFEAYGRKYRTTVTSTKALDKGQVDYFVEAAMTRSNEWLIDTALTIDCLDYDASMTIVRTN
ncbi:hypothetical protein BGX28_010019 [Mortierella sp. GBA30]|nr:hypothetical protein BGX28_010019 [Mortierella sp. GBA30]